MLAIPMLAAGIFVGPLLIAAVAFVIVTPTILGAVFGYRVNVRYDQDMLRPGTRTRRYASTASLTVFIILGIVELWHLLLLSVG